MLRFLLTRVSQLIVHPFGTFNRPSSYSAKEPGSSVIVIPEIRLSGVRASIIIVHIRKFYKMLKNIVRFRFFFRIAKRSIPNRSNRSKVIRYSL